MSSSARTTPLTSGATAARDRLFAAIDAIAPRLEAANAEADASHGPTVDMVEAMHEAGLMGVKAPLAVGGLEADWTLQFEVLERVAYHSLSAAWCLMLYIDNTGKAAASLPETGLARIMAGGRIPAICGGGGLMMGELTSAPGGFTLNGRWVYGSGIPQADFVMITAKLADGEAGAGEVRQVVVPRREMSIADNWRVMGLKGTGSGDFAAKDVLVPLDMVFDPRAPALRGGALYKLGTFGYAGLCMPAVMLGAARRALDELAESAARKSRGYMTRTTLAHRGVFQVFLAEADLKLKAARGLAIGIGEKLLADVEAQGSSPEANEVETRAVGTYCSKAAIEVINGIVGYAGGEGIRAGHLFERTLRDLHTAGTHMFVSDIAYENHAKLLMKLPDAAISI